MNTNVLASACALVLASACASQQPTDAGAVAKEMLEQFQKEGIVFDGKAKTVSIQATVNAAPDPIEYLLIHRRGKRHEAVFITDSKPSILNAALMLLGLQPGQNATYKEKDPPPSAEEIEKGADPLVVTPPKGGTFWMTVAWKDKDGQRREYAVEDLLLDMTTRVAVTKAEWVFLGGRLARLYKNDPEVFVADFEGNLISTCYLSPDNHLGTMSHERGRDDHNWWITDKCPEPGTVVTFTFCKDKPKLVVDREAALEKAAKEEAAKAATKPGEPKKQ